MRKILITSLIFSSTLISASAVTAEDDVVISEQALQNAHLYFVDGRVPTALQARLREEQLEGHKGPSEDYILIKFYTNWYRNSEAYAYSKLCDGYAGEKTRKCHWKVWHAKLPEREFRNWDDQSNDFELAARDLNARSIDTNSMQELEHYMPIDGIRDPLDTFTKRANVRSISSKRCEAVMQGLEALKIKGEPVISVSIGSLTKPPNDGISLQVHATRVEIDFDLSAVEDDLYGELKLRGTKGHSSAGKYASLLLDPLEKCRWESE